MWPKSEKELSGRARRPLPQGLGFETPGRHISLFKFSSRLSHEPLVKLHQAAKFDFFRLPWVGIAPPPP
ncbi:hypothetical protein VNO77_44216 [Canavalia gladiata]|uniref:Uncharacterized protein n=1 Tax=Canavalia gladiata TaxID=3824 RepID=A0AAN9PQ63_CANGL